MKDELTIQEYPAKILYEYIKAFKVYHFTNDMEVRLLPKGVFEIVFQSHHSFQHNTDYSSGWELRPRNFIGGLHNKSYFVNSGVKRNYCIVVEFKANTAKYFIPEKLHAFQNAVIDISDIWGDSAHELSQMIDRERSDKHKIDHIENFLLQKFKLPKKSGIEVALNRIFASMGFVEVNELANHSLLSIAQFRKRFKEEIGISPSQYCKIVRVNNALEIMKNNKNASLTELTYVLGYFDQSHFIKDFKSVIGSSPKTLRSSSFS